VGNICGSEQRFLPVLRRSECVKFKYRPLISTACRKPVATK
jgi:hypothetical protein